MNMNKHRLACLMICVWAFLGDDLMWMFEKNCESSQDGVIHVKLPYL